MKLDGGCYRFILFWKVEVVENECKSILKKHSRKNYEKNGKDEN